MRIGDLIPFSRKSSDLASYRDPFDWFYRDFRDLWNRLPRDARLLDTQDFSVDVIDRDKEIIVKADVPGFASGDLSAEVNQNILTIRGERRTEKKEEEDNYYLMERQYGAFSRSLQLPFSVPDTQKIDAKLKDGLLTLTIPKTKESLEKTEKIKIKEA